MTKKKEKKPFGGIRKKLEEAAGIMRKVSSGQELKTKGKKKGVGPFMTEAEYRKLGIHKKRKVFYPKSDFSTINEFIDTMRKPPISDTEAENVDWDKEMKGEGK